MHNCKNIQYSRYSRSRLAILLLSLYLLASSGTATKVTKESDPRGAQRKSQAAKSALEEGDADRLERVDKRKIPHKSMPNDPKDLRNAKVNADILAAAVSHTAMDETTGWVPTWVIPIVSFVSAVSGSRHSLPTAVFYDLHSLLCHHCDIFLVYPRASFISIFQKDWDCDVFYTTDLSARSKIGCSVVLQQSFKIR